MERTLSNYQNLAKWVWEKYYTPHFFKLSEEEWKDIKQTQALIGYIAYKQKMKGKELYRFFNNTFYHLIKELGYYRPNGSNNSKFFVKREYSIPDISRLLVRPQEDEFYG